MWIFKDIFKGKQRVSKQVDFVRIVVLTHHVKNKQLIQTQMSKWFPKVKSKLLSDSDELTGELMWIDLSSQQR
jgi:hypothetical protein